MDNFIYILIGIAWVAYSIYSARQKAIQKQQASGLPPRGPSQSAPLPIPGNQGGGKTLFDDILREITGESRPVPQLVEKPVMPVKQPKPENVSELNQKYEGYSGYKFIQSVSNDSSMNKSGHDWNKQKKPEEMTRLVGGSQRFDLRQAVIYSELLNPKYF